MQQFFRFPKAIITTCRWAKLSSAAKCVYPVIGVHANLKGEAWPAMQRIGDLSGLTRQTVSKAVRALSRAQIVHNSFRVTERGHVQYTYQLPLPKQGRRRAFFFDRSLVDDGVWASLSTPAKALYPVLRTYAYPDFECYDIEDDQAEAMQGRYADLDYEFCDPDPWVLANHSNLSESSIYRGLRSLLEHGLLEETDVHCDDDSPRKRWKVYRAPVLSF
jgi:predicted transcriptional regulator